MEVQAKGRQWQILWREKSVAWEREKKRLKTDLVPWQREIHSPAGAGEYTA